MATGLLVVVVGAATRLSNYLTPASKTYRATLELGRATDTADAQGATTRVAKFGFETLRRAADVMRGLVGAHELPPPAYSAVQVAGRRAHEAARQGQALTLPVRPMTVHAVEDVIEQPPDRVLGTLGVSKGTYIRSLAELVGERTGIPCHLAGLHRLGSGDLSLADGRVVGGIDVEWLEAASNGKPRTRLRVGGPSDDRASQAAHLLNKMMAPWDALPFPIVWAGADDPRGTMVLRRLGQGQPVALVDQHGLGAVWSDLEPRLVSFDDRVMRVGVARRSPQPALLIARVERGPEPTLRAERTILAPTTQFSPSA